MSYLPVSNILVLQDHNLFCISFQPRFDHNLRDKDGDTPLMVACKYGRVEMVKFLLQSAVYANHMPGDDE